MLCEAAAGDGGGDDDDDDEEEKEDDDDDYDVNEPWWRLLQQWYLNDSNVNFRWSCEFAVDL